MKERIVFLANAANIHTQRWAIHLAKNYAVTVFSFENASIDGVEVIQLRSAMRGLLRYVWVLPFVSKGLSKIRPKILHAHYAGGYGLLGMLCGFKPYILSVWGSDIYQAPNESMIFRWILKIILRRADYLCSTSSAMAFEASKYCERNFLITPFGVDCDTYKSIDEALNPKSFIIGTVKKLDSLYGVDRLLRAFSILTKERREIDLRLLIVGDGKERENLTQLANDLGISSLVDFYGEANQEDVPVLLNQMKIYVALSRSESFGVSVLEASACKVPVIVSDAGGLPEVVVNGSTGFVIKDGEPIEAARALAKLIDDSFMRTQMGTAGREFVKSKYQWEHTATDMDNLYVKILGNSNSKSKSQ